MSDRCSKCKAEITLVERNCPVCQTDAGFPNVRFARQQDEVTELTRRYDKALTLAEARGILVEISSFETAVGSSRAVMNRTLGALNGWLNGPSELFLTFHNQVKYTGRIPNETNWDLQRAAAEAAINPFYYEHISFAALSLDGHGTDYYGPYAVTLRSDTIDHRTSVFESNIFNFNKIHNVIAGQSPPLGYRSSWEDRKRLAVAKLQAAIQPHSTAHQFPSVLFESKRSNSDCEFVEVHIFGPINRRGIEMIAGPEPTSRADRALWRQLTRKAKDLGVAVEVTT